MTFDQLLFLTSRGFKLDVIMTFQKRLVLSGIASIPIVTRHHHRYLKDTPCPILQKLILSSSAFLRKIHQLYYKKKVNSRSEIHGIIRKRSRQRRRAKLPLLLKRRRKKNVLSHFSPPKDTAKKLFPL